MARYRSILGILLAAIATFLVSCGGPSTPETTTYTPEQIEQIQTFTPAVEQMRSRFPELEEYIRQKDWVNVKSFIHGPMGDLRMRLGQLAARLLPPDQKQAKSLADDLFNRLERLDEAAENYNQIEAGRQYRQALDDFDAFLELVPSESEQAA